MANDYYNHSGYSIERGTTARADNINNIGTALEVGLDKLPTENQIKRGLVNYGTESGAADAYVVTMPFTDTAYTDGYLVTFVPGNTNTGASTLNVDSLGAKSILKADGTALVAGDLTAAKPISVRYNTAGDCFYLQSSSPADATAAAASAVAAAASAAAASTSESNAATSESNASTSASNASTSASNASTSESNAAASATLSQDWAIYETGFLVNGIDYSSKHYAAQSSASAGNASSSASAASISAGTASTAANNASTSASNASTSAGNAATSETNAATSETNAATSANNASTSETNAAASEAAAAASEVAAAASAAASANSAVEAASYTHVLPDIAGMTFPGVGTVVDAVVYDTSLDTDGGAWRHRCSNTSWFMEVPSHEGSYLGAMTTTARDLLNPSEGDLIWNTTTSTWQKYIANNLLYVGEHYGNTNSTWNNTTRGIRREFPAVVAVIAEATKVWIFDVTGSEPVLWLNTDGASASDILVNIQVGNPISSIAVVNGEIVVGCGLAFGLNRVNFIKDSSLHLNTTGNREYKGSIAQRNDGLSVGGYLDSNPLVNGTVNDVAITTLPNAPIDSATGLPVPTIAVATAAGNSIIQNDGTVKTAAIDANACAKVEFDGLYLHSTLSAYSNIRTYDATSGAFVRELYVSQVPEIGADTDKKLSVTSNGSIALGGSTKLVHLKENTTTPSEGMVAYTTASYCSGYMPGDVKLAALASTTAESIVGTELVTNGTFDTDTSGWTAAGSPTTFAVSGNKLHVVASAGNLAQGWQGFTTVVGKTYTASCQISSSSNDNGFRVGTTTTGGELAQDYGSGDRTIILTFTATATTTYTSTMTQDTIGVGYFDNISVKLADPDRSVNGNGLQVNGTITKSAVATGAELMAYSGFSASNYLEQPYNSDLDFGTGDFYVMGWAYFTSSGTYGGFIDRVTDKTPASLGGHALMFICGGSNFMQAYINGANLVGTAGSCPNNSWVFCTLVRKDGIATIYINGRYDVSMSAPATVTDTTATTTVGAYWYNNIPQADLWKIGLVHIGAGAPTADDIKFIYNQEKPLFQANAKCTLAGSNNAITNMDWNEYKQQLYVNNGIKNVFSGLKRIPSHWDKQPELVVNGTFDTDTTWTDEYNGGGGTIVIADGVMKMTQGGTSVWISAMQPVDVTGIDYVVLQVERVAASGGEARVGLNTTDAGGAQLSAPDIAYLSFTGTTVGAKSIIADVSAYSTVYLYLFEGSAAGGYSYLDNITLRKSESPTIASVASEAEYEVVI